MDKFNLKKSWEWVIKETHKIPNWEEIDRNSKKYQKIIMLREIILFCPNFLNKIESGENKKFNVLIFKKYMSFYCKEMKNTI